MLTNYHCHSNYCDGKASLEDYVLKALELGVDVLGFSSHSPVPFANNWSMKSDRLEDYLNDILILKRKYRDRIEVYSGLEIDYVHHVCGPKDFKYQLDYTIGSIHYCKQFEDGSLFEIDGNSNVFYKGIIEIYHKDIDLFLCEYYSQIEHMVLTDPPTIIGHLDKIKMHNLGNRFWDASSESYLHYISQTLDTIAAHDIFVEVNTRGIYKKITKETYPSLSILKMMHERGIKVVVNSDCHTPDELVEAYGFALQMLKAAGYKESWHLSKNIWQPAKI